MTNIKAIIVEDEPLVRERIRNLLLEDSAIQIVAECSNGLVGIKAIQKYQPQLLFLDIQMPLKSGFEVLADLPMELHPTTIFVTAYDEFALKAFEFEAFDYLLKPFNRQRFMTALERAKKRVREKQNHQAGYSTYLLIKQKEEHLPIPVKDLIWITSEGNYALLYTTNQCYSIRKTLSEIEDILNPEHFRRIHRSTIINIQHIAKMSHLYQGDYRIELKNGKLFTSSKSYRENLRFLLGKA